MHFYHLFCFVVCQKKNIFLRVLVAAGKRAIKHILTLTQEGFFLLFGTFPTNANV